MNKGSL